jgi:hypothetical protein
MDGDTINDIDERLYTLNKTMERIAVALEAIGEVLETRKL